MNNLNGRRPQPEGRSFREGASQPGTPSRPVVAPRQDATEQTPKKIVKPADSPERQQGSRQQNNTNKPNRQRPSSTTKGRLTSITSWVKAHKVPAAIIALAIIVAIGATTWYLATKDDQNQASSEVARQYQEQLPDLKKKVNDNPDDANARKNYAVALYATQNLDEARKQYEEATKLNDKDASAFNNLGNVYRDLGQLDKAIESYRKSIELNPKVVNPYSNLANIQLYSKNQANEAIKTYQSGLKEMPDNVQLELLLGVAYAHKGDEEKAKATYRNILSRDGDNAAAKANLDRLEGNNEDED